MGKGEYNDLHFVNDLKNQTPFDIDITIKIKIKSHETICLNIRSTELLAVLFIPFVIPWWWIPILTAIIAVVVEIYLLFKAFLISFLSPL